jgi:hypothetical protein
MLEKILQELHSHAVYIDQKDQLMVELPQIKNILENSLKDQDKEYKERIEELQKQLILLNTTLISLSR